MSKNKRWLPSLGASSNSVRCPCHEGLFDPETGGVLAGPPPRPFPRIALGEENRMLYAVEETPR